MCAVFASSSADDAQCVQAQLASDIRFSEFVQLRAENATLKADVSVIPFSSVPYVKCNKFAVCFQLARLQRSADIVTPTARVGEGALLSERRPSTRSSSRLITDPHGRVFEFATAKCISPEHSVVHLPSVTGHDVHSKLRQSHSMSGNPLSKSRPSTQPSSESPVIHPQRFTPLTVVVSPVSSPRQDPLQTAPSRLTATRRPM